MFLTTDAILIHWAVSEAKSPRWYSQFADLISPAMARKLIGLHSVSELNAAEVAILVGGLTSYRAHLIDRYLACVTGAKRERVSTEWLAELIVMQEMCLSPTPYALGHYIDGPQDPAALTDPRRTAMLLADQTPAPVMWGYPVIVPDAGYGCEVLIEGFTRCLLKMLQARKAGEGPGYIEVLRCIKRDN